MNERNSPDVSMLLGSSGNVIDGWSLFNLNCYDYLKNIVLTITPAVEVYCPYGKTIKNIMMHPDHSIIPYDETISYGEMYHDFIENLQNNIQKIATSQKARAESIKTILISNQITIGGSQSLMIEDYYNVEMINKDYDDIDKFIDSIYSNHNKSLERSAEFAKIALGDKSVISGKKAKELIYNKSKGVSESASMSDAMLKKMKYRLSFFASEVNPSHQESRMIRGYKTFVSSTFQPQLTTSLPSIREYNFHRQMGNPWVEYRFGTQGEYINSIERVNPLFVAWTEAQERKHFYNNNIDNPPLHIYFNNLALDREKKGLTDFSGMAEVYERKLTLQLHELENNHPSIFVITLPADKGFLNNDMLKSDIKMSIPQAFDEMKHTATLGSQLNDASLGYDFYISNRAKRLLYGPPRANIQEAYNHQQEIAIIERLLLNSFTALQFDKNLEFLTGAQVQALYFHFIKYELTNYIINTLNPLSINFTCKDAIDRGGVSSLYFNLITSIKNGTPMTKDEFITALHGAPTMVKGRGMNDHVDRVWNAIRCYLDGQAGLQTAIPDWLIRMKKEDMIEPIISALDDALAKTVKRKSFDYYSHFSGEKANEADYKKLNDDIVLECIKTLQGLMEEPTNISSKSLTSDIINSINVALDTLGSVNAMNQQALVAEHPLEAELKRIREDLIIKFNPEAHIEIQPTRHSF